MIKILALVLLVVQCNCQSYVSSYGNSLGGYGSGLATSGLFGVSGLSGLSSLGSSYGSGLGSSYGSGLGSGYILSSGNGLGSSSLGSLGSYGSYGSLGSLGSSYSLGNNVVSVPVVQQQSYAAVPVYSSGYSQSAQSGPVNAAIQTIRRTVEHRPVPYSGEPVVPQEVIVEPSEQPVSIHFRSKSSPLIVTQEHIPGEPGQVQQTQSEDEAHRVVHEVTKPVIQEVREVIQPYRQVTQEINPVVEQVHTVVSRGEGQRQVVQPVRQVQQVQQVAVQPVQQLVQAVRPFQVQAVQPVVSTYQVAQPISTVGVIAAQPFGLGYSSGSQGIRSIGGLGSIGSQGGFGSGYRTVGSFGNGVGSFGSGVGSFGSGIGSYGSGIGSYGSGVGSRSFRTI